MDIHYLPNLSYGKLKCIFYLTVILIFFTHSNALASTTSRTPLSFDIKYKEVLILTSKSDNMIWEGKLLEYLLQQFTRDTSLRLNTETLTSFDNDEAYMDKEAEFLFMKYAKTKFNLILCLDDESAEFIAKYYDNTSLYNTPIVYCGINDITKLHRYPFNFFTGVLESPNPRLLIDTILNISPEATKINIILDETIASYQTEKLIRDLAPYYSSKVKFNYIKSKYIEDISSALSSMNEVSPSILVGNFKNSSNTNISPSDTINLLRTCYTGLLYTLNYSYIGKGAIGGYLPSPENHGKLTYEVATRILNGDSMHSVSPIIDLDHKFIFDVEQVVRSGINKKALPKSSLYINDNWINQKFPATIVLLLIISIIISIILMLFFAIKKNENEKKAKLVKARYDEVVVNDKMKTEFIANFSHEIRTLLNVMLSSLQLLDLYKENGKIIFTEEKDALKLSYIRRNGLRLLKLINNLIDISKLDSGFYHTEFEMKNVVDIVEDITLSVVEYAEAKNINIVFDTNEEEFFMPVDIEKLDRIILNLLSNSIKFTPSGGNVYVTLNCEAHAISISVRDTGVGISKEDQSLIFNRFIQASNTSSSSSPGSGIGLSLVKSLTELLDGTIALNSELNKGAEFVITLPVKDFDKATTDALCHVNAKLANNSDKIKVEFSDINL